MKNYTPVIGLEVHIELATEAKMFCSCSARHFGQKPNTHVCPVCLGMPGGLPVPNKKAIGYCQLLGRSVGCKLRKNSKFDRKHYFYPDLPKGYQISQYDKPFCEDGTYTMQTGETIRIRRVHMEEDTGKLVHQTLNMKKVSLIDFNRSGVPLVELVTQPDFESAQAAKHFVQELQQIVRYLDISDADMEKGSMRLEANISLRSLVSTTLPDYRVEVKNINSFRFLEQAINFEIKRQTELLEKGERLIQETRGYNQDTGETKLQRRKEEAQDYRYFPDPDIPPFEFSPEYIKDVDSRVPELPNKKKLRFEKEFDISTQYSSILSRDKNLAAYFEEAARIAARYEIPAKKIADLLINRKPDTREILPAKLVELIKKSEDKPIFSDKELENAVLQVIGKNPQVCKDYLGGKETSLEYLIGQTLKTLQGRADPLKVRELMLKHINKFVVEQ